MYVNGPMVSGMVVVRVVVVVVVVKVAARPMGGPRDPFPPLECVLPPATAVLFKRGAVRIVRGGVPERDMHHGIILAVFTCTYVAWWRTGPLRGVSSYTVCTLDRGFVPHSSFAAFAAVVPSLRLTSTKLERRKDPPTVLCGFVVSGCTDLAKALLVA
jgi:hypothetical protein